MSKVLCVLINQEKGLRAETNVNIAHLQCSTCYFVLTNFDHFQRLIKLYVRILTNQTIRRNG